MGRDRDSLTRHDDAVLAGLRGPTRQLLLQLLMYKAIFMGSSFRALAEEEPEEVAEVLLRIHEESGGEAAGLTLALHEWDAIAAGDAAAQAAADARRRFIEDLLAIKEGVVDVGIIAAMRAPTEELRRRLLRLADVDRQHADALRRILGARTVADHLGNERPPSGDPPLGVGAGRPEGGSLRRRIQDALDELREHGGEPFLLLLSADAARHARDEGVIDPRSGRAFDLPVEIDMGWRGECFAVQTLERVAYAELIAAREGRGQDAP